MSLQVLEKIRDELLQCEVLSSTVEFCRSGLAKDESYLRVLRHHGCNASADVFATCASKLGYYAKHFGVSNDPTHQEWAELFLRLRDLCVFTMEAQGQGQVDDSDTDGAMTKAMGLQRLLFGATKSDGEILIVPCWSFCHTPSCRSCPC